MSVKETAPGSFRNRLSFHIQLTGITLTEYSLRNLARGLLVTKNHPPLQLGTSWISVYTPIRAVDDRRKPFVICLELPAYLCESGI